MMDHGSGVLMLETLELMKAVREKWGRKVGDQMTLIVRMATSSRVLLLNLKN